MSKKSIFSCCGTTILLAHFFLCPSFTTLCSAEEKSQAPTPPLQIKRSYAPIVKKVRDSIVSINAIQQRPLFDKDLFGSLFGIPKGNLSNNSSQKKPSRTTSMGSGAIISDKGFVITCAHVILGADKIKVKLADNREFDAKIAILDKSNDLAILKIEDSQIATSTLPFIPLAENGNLEVGDFVLALGNPFSVGLSVTNGIISALSQNVNGRILIQTDAPINPGNSGGALVDLEGKLVAIPNAILSKTGGSDGIGFAIPISVVKPLLKAAISGKGVEHPWDGLTLETLKADRAESLSLKDIQGAFITKVNENSPAAEAGIKSSDIITEINGTKITSAEDYIMKLQNITVGDNVVLKIVSKNEKKEITFKLGTPPRIPEPDETLIDGKNILSGFKIANLSPALAIDNGFDVTKSGVVILDTAKEKTQNGINLSSPLTLMQGDIISELNGKSIKKVTDLKESIKESFTHMTIQRGKNKIEIKASKKN